MKSAFVYILHSVKVDRYYIGSTLDVERRKREHDDGFVNATKYLRPLELVFSQKYDTVLQARKVECKLKRMKSRVILERIIKDKKILLTV